MGYIEPMHKCIKEFPKRMAFARTQKGLSQADIGKLSGLHTTAINHYENGNRAPGIENLCLIADALAVTTDWLLGRE